MYYLVHDSNPLTIDSQLQVSFILQVLNILHNYLLRQLHHIPDIGRMVKTYHNAQYIA